MTELRFDWERVIRRAPLPSEVKGTALMLATYANADGSSIFPGNDRLCRVLGVTDKTIRRHLERLRVDGYIVRTDTQQRRAAYRLADVYCLAIPDDFTDRPGVLDPDERSPQRRSPMTGAQPERRSPVSRAAVTHDHARRSPMTGHQITHQPLTNTDHLPT